ncbi:type 1 glutamine amidotransferase [Priestia megaterium]|uniref:type 1 glutamine amidotransferase n=1 Tax=Priestia megaterium TaxID=1404 RepID=UPI00406BD58C
MRIHYIQNDPLAGPGTIEIWAAQHGYALTSTKVYEKCDFPSTDEFDFLIILGGHMGAYEEETYPWILLEKQFIRKTVEQNKFVLGICLGAQLIADALGGKAYPHTHKESGWWGIELDKEAENVQLLRGFPKKFTAVEFHGDTFDLPKGAIRLSSSKGCKNQIFIYQDRVIGLQFHPEFTNDMIDNVLKNSDFGRVQGEFMQKPEDILNQTVLLNQSKNILFKLFDNIINKFNEEGQ